MKEKFEGNVLPQEHEDKFGKAVESVEISADEAKTVLWKYSDERAMGKKIKLTPEELRTVAYSWEKLDPKIQNLALTAYPEIAAALLNIELTEKKEK